MGVTRVDQGICVRGRPLLSLSFPLLLPFPIFLPFPLEVSPLNQLGSLGSAVSAPSGVRGRARPKTNLVHSKAVKKPLVAIILNILSTTIYVFEEINWRWCRHNTVPLSHIRSTVSDGVSPSPKVGGGRSRFGPL